MIAITNIEENTCLVKIPKECLLYLRNTNLIKSINIKDLKSESNWARLVIALMYELDNGSKSKWAPYLTTFPNYNHLDLPIFWQKLLNLI
jgi:hypothetical protein